LPLRIESLAAIPQFGQSEAVVLGQPQVGLLFCQDFSKGLSDHLGIKDGFGLYLFTDWIVEWTAPATSVKPFSTCLIGRIGSLVPLILDLLLMIASRGKPHARLQSLYELSGNDRAAEAFRFK
jgi:hypothetical protein